MRKVRNVAMAPGGPGQAVSDYLTEYQAWLVGIKIRWLMWRFHRSYWGARWWERTSTAEYRARGYRWSKASGWERLIDYSAIRDAVYEGEDDA